MRLSGREYNDFYGSASRFQRPSALPIAHLHFLPAIRAARADLEVYCKIAPALLL